MTKELKNWSIEDFLAECKELRDNQYTYNYDNMPEGICNNHKVQPFKPQWKSVAIDNCVINLHSDELCTYRAFGKDLTSVEYVEELLKREPPKHYRITYKSSLSRFADGIISSEFDGTEAELKADIEHWKEAMGAYDVNVECLGYSWEF